MYPAYASNWVPEVPNSSRRSVVKKTYDIAIATIDRQNPRTYSLMLKALSAHVDPREHEHTKIVEEIFVSAVE